jgi:hypothetical protein
LIKILFFLRQKSGLDCFRKISQEVLLINPIKMSYQAYLDNIKAKTGKGPDDFRRIADQKGFSTNGMLKPGIKTGEIVNWLKTEFELGHGHSMAIYALLKGIKDENSD